MPATQISHGVITISAPKAATPTEQSVASVVSQPSISTGAPPPVVVQHKTVADIQEEAAAVAKEAEQLISDAATATAS